MSTYTLALFISEFSTRTNYKSGHSIHARPNVIQNTNFSFKIEDKIVKKFEEITEIPFGITKMDLVAIPFFTKDAMENWGAVFFK